VHRWTNDKALDHQLSSQGKARRYHDDMQAAGVAEIMKFPEVEVAFQMLNSQSGAASNDRDIFSSVSTLMKAQAYQGVDRHRHLAQPPALADDIQQQPLLVWKMRRATSSLSAARAGRCLDWAPVTRTTAFSIFIEISKNGMGNHAHLILTTTLPFARPAST
jgi:hypothetical protein